MSDLVGGFYPKEKHERAPDYVIGKLSINVAQFRDWMKQHLADHPEDEWINMEMLVSKGGKGYAKVDDWKPNGNAAARGQAASEPEQPTDFEDDDIPF